jgi:hypothetical protein
MKLAVVIIHQAKYAGRLFAAKVEVSENFCGLKVLRGQRRGSLRPSISGLCYTYTYIYKREVYISVSC